MSSWGLKCFLYMGVYVFPKIWEIFCYNVIEYVSMSLVCVSAFSSTPQIIWFGLLIVSHGSQRLWSNCYFFFSLLLSECNISTILSSTSNILSSAWSCLLMMLSIVFLILWAFHFQHFCLSIFDNFNFFSEFLIHVVNFLV
jgi:hypothetical protein